MLYTVVDSVRHGSTPRYLSSFLELDPFSFPLHQLYISNTGSYPTCLKFVFVAHRRFESASFASQEFCAPVSKGTPYELMSVYPSTTDQ